MFHGVVNRNVVHRARTIQGHQRNNIFKAVRSHTCNRAAHALTFQLEHANGLTRSQKLIGQRIIDRDLFDLHFNAALLDMRNRRINHRQRFKAKEVKLHQTGSFHPFHVELGNRHIRARVSVERHQLF